MLPHKLPVIRFGYPSECASHHPNALAIRMRKPSKLRGGTALLLSEVVVNKFSEYYHLYIRSYLFLRAKSTGERKQGGTPPNAYSAYAFGWLAHSDGGWRIRIDIQTQSPNH